MVELSSKVNKSKIDCNSYNKFRGDRKIALNWPPSSFPFHSLDNVVMSPHRGGGLHTPDVEEKRYEDIEHLLQQIEHEGWEQIKNHPNIFSPAKGY